MFARDETLELVKAKSGLTKQKSRRGDDTRTEHSASRASHLDKSRANLHEGPTSMADLYEEKVVEEKKPHPFDAIFGNRLNTLIQTNSAGTSIGLTFAEFKEISWPN